MNKDPNFIAKLEKAISQKYGEESIVPPQTNWDEEKEKDYLEQVKTLSSSPQHSKKEEIIENEGFTLQSKLIIKENKKECPVCKTYTKYIEDDIFFIKYNCCKRCYLVNEDKIKKGLPPK